MATGTKRGAGIEGRRLRRTRPEGREIDHQRRQSERGGDGEAPVDAAEGVQQMRRTGAERQRPDDEAEQQTQVVVGPGGRHLHADRITPGHHRSGDGTAEDDRRRGRLQPQDGGIGDGADQRREHKEAPGIKPIGEAQHGARQGADDETRLHGAGIEGGERRPDFVFETECGSTAVAENQSARAAVVQSARRLSDRRFAA